MFNIFKLAARNLKRYKRRTFLTSMLITLGVVAVLLFVSISGSFKVMMISQITDSMLGHLQIHRKGYLASIDSLPLNRNLSAKQVAKIKQVLAEEDAVDAYALRIKLGAMFSNFAETTNIRLNAVFPEQELNTVPLLSTRIVQGQSAGLINKGEVLIPELIAKGMKVKVGDAIVLVAIVLVSIMNVMIMAVYERINEIGTIAAIGTLPSRILGIFVVEGFLLGILGTAIGTVISLIAIAAMNAFQISFDFGRQTGLRLAPTISAGEVAVVVLTVIGIAVVASLQPAYKAAKMDPIVALRHV